MGARKFNFEGSDVFITPDPDKINYNNDGMNNVSNAKEALDNLHNRVSSLEVSGVGGSAAPIYLNHQLPVWKDNIKVLCIGNSFCIYPCGEMHTLFNGAGLANGSVVFKVCHSAARPLSTWLDYIKSNGEITQLHDFYYSTNDSLWKHTYSGPVTGLRSVVAGTKWDVILLQVYPPTGGNVEYASSYESYKSVLKEMIFELRKNCTNPNVCIAWNMIWSASQSQSSYTSTWKNIVNAVKKMVSDCGIDIVVPTGTAYMNAINTNTFNGANHHLLMIDGVGHPGQGVARYISSCVFYETLIAPVLGKSMYGLTNIPIFTQTTNPTYADAEIAVNAENIELCQRIALAAICDMYNVNTSLDPIAT